MFVNLVSREFFKNACFIWKYQIGGRPTKISEGMRKVCMSAVIVWGLDSVAQATKLVNEQMGYNISV
jgi:hypothetical protein